jgi:hypothetical protein
MATQTKDPHDGCIVRDHHWRHFKLFGFGWRDRWLIDKWVGK